MALARPCGGSAASRPRAGAAATGLELPRAVQPRGAPQEWHGYIMPTAGSEPALAVLTGAQGSVLPGCSGSVSARARNNPDGWQRCCTGTQAAFYSSPWTADTKPGLFWARRLGGTFMIFSLRDCFCTQVLSWLFLKIWEYFYPTGHLYSQRDN